ncbi:hypothetical protein K1719_041936 [Acacia pycnantha]|nr:hypothetical protein K1719_041936 [Acacia pycnantha]
MGRLFLIDLEGDFYSCKYCNTPLALANDVISEVSAQRQTEQYKVGKFILKSVNVTVGEKEERMMITGLHTVVDIFCVTCLRLLALMAVDTCQFKKLILLEMMVMRLDLAHLRAFAQLLQAPRDDAQIIIRDRFPVPRLVVCDQHGSQAKFLLAKLNLSATYNSAHEMAAGSDVIFTDDVSLQVFFEHLQKLAVQS